MLRGSSVFLSGPMGVGKSTSLTAVAARMGWAAIDLDAEVERRAGKPIREIFATQGELAFRELERHTMLELLDREGLVVALGGGTVLDDAVRRRLLREGTLITLTAPLETLLERVTGGEGRPLLQGDPRARLERILRDRAAVYAECHATLSADDALPERVAELHARADVVVPLGTRSYRVEIGHGIRARLPERARDASRVICVTDENARRWSVPTARSVEVVLTPGETHKRVAAVEAIWDAALAAECDRGSCVVAIGGGVVGDLAGFAAATLMRGVAFGQIPTTLLAMVDSSVGGKTGFNRDAGKNLVGAFHQPRFVLCDVETLETLPERELRAAFAEVVKSAWLDGEASVAMLERDVDALLARDPDALERAIRMSVRLKADVVADDEHEAGRRMVLNLGHTVGHAIEAATGYETLRHGEAVSLGLVAATRVSRQRGEMSGADAERLVSLMTRLELPVDLDAYLGAQLEPFLRSDKKRRGDRVRFVLVGGPGRVKIEPLRPEDVLAML